MAPKPPSTGTPARELAAPYIEENERDDTPEVSVALRNHPTGEIEVEVEGEIEVEIELEL